MEDRLWGPLRDDGVVVVGVNTGGLFNDDTVARIEAFIAQTGVTFPVVRDHDQVKAYDTGLAISPFPVDVVIDRDGVIRYVSAGYDADTLLAVVQSLL